MIEGEDIYGDGVNIAARLQSLAPTGGITVSQSFVITSGNNYH
jgi:adenylate cyclase